MVRSQREMGSGEPTGMPTPTPAPTRPLPPNTPMPTDGWARYGTPSEIQVCEPGASLRAGMPQRATTSSCVAPCQDCFACSRSFAVVAHPARTANERTTRLRAMRASGLGNGFHRPARVLPAAILARQVAERDDTHQALLAAHHRQATHLDVGHVAGDVLQVLILVAILDLRAHHLAHRCFRAFALRNRAHGDVAVGDHADEAVVLSHRHRAGVELVHYPGYVADGLAGAGNAHVARHCIAYTHGHLLGLTSACPARDRPRRWTPARLWRCRSRPRKRPSG